MRTSPLELLPKGNRGERLDSAWAEEGIEQAPGSIENVGPGACLIRRTPSVQEPGDQLGILDDQKQADDLDDDKRYDASIQIRCLNLRRGDPSEIEQGEPERRRQEGGLEVHADHHSEPNQVDPHEPSGGCQQGDDDEGNLEEIEEEPENENDQVRGNEEPDASTREVGEQRLNPDVSVQASKNEGKGRGTDEQEHDHRGELGRIHAR